jgi:hypothetical protein
VAPGRNTAILIAVAARNQLLKERGWDAAQRFAERVDAMIAAGERTGAEGDEEGAGKADGEGRARPRSSAKRTAPRAARRRDAARPRSAARRGR